jgi:hypothetical protein
VEQSSAMGLRLAPLVLWFILGLGVGTGALAAVLATPGAELPTILQVGENSATRTLVESELGQIPEVQGPGHDGQYSYLIARDPFALHYTNLADNGGYRYRKALYSWLAGGFGLLSPQATLWGLALLAIIGVGLASAAIADIATSIDASLFAVAGVLANAGLWLSVQLATSDALAVGLSLIGVALVLRRKPGLAGWIFAAAVLAKDAFLLFPAALFAWAVLSSRYKIALRVFVPPVVALTLWSVWLAHETGGGLSMKGGLDMPFLGLLRSFESSDGLNLVLAGVALFGIALAVTGFSLDRSPMLRSLIAPWVLIAIVSSVLVWKDGNNAVRVFASDWALGFLAVAHWRAQRMTPTGPVATEGRRDFRSHDLGRHQPDHHNGPRSGG